MTSIFNVDTSNIVTVTLHLDGGETQNANFYRCSAQFDNVGWQVILRKHRGECPVGLRWNPYGRQRQGDSALPPERASRET